MGERCEDACPKGNGYTCCYNCTLKEDCERFCGELKSECKSLLIEVERGSKLGGTDYMGYRNRGKIN